MNRNLANLLVWSVLAAGPKFAAAQPSPAPAAAQPSPAPVAAQPSPAPVAAQPSPTPVAGQPSLAPAAAQQNCTFTDNGLTVAAEAESVNLVATLENPPKTRVSLSINGHGGFHRELVWDPAVGDGLQHDVLLRRTPPPDKDGEHPYKLMAFAEDDRIQTAQVVVVTTTQFTTCERTAAAPAVGAANSPKQAARVPDQKPDSSGSSDEVTTRPCPDSLLATETIMSSSRKTTTVVVGAPKPHVSYSTNKEETPRLRLKCDSGKVALSELHLNRKELVAASVARGFLDQAAPAVVTDTLALLAEIAIERARAGAFELVKQRFVDPICGKLKLRLLGLGGDARAFPRTCMMLSNMRLEDLLSSGRSLVDAARDDARLTLLPALVTKLNMPSAARDLAALALKLGNEMLGGGGSDVADLDLLVTQLDRSFLHGAVASLESIKNEFISSKFSAGIPDSVKEQLIQQVLERALPEDPGALISRYVDTTANEKALAAALSLAATPKCARRKDTKRSYVEADRPACIGALTQKLATGDWIVILQKILPLDELVGLVSATRRAGGRSDFETWIEERIQPLNHAAVSGLTAVVPDALKRSCAVRVAIAVVKWCSRRDSCTASDIATAIDRPEALFAAPKEEEGPEWLCWSDAKTLRLPAVRTAYVELAARALAFLTPPPKGEERKRVQAVVRWMFDLAKSLELTGPESSLQKLAEIVEMFEQRDYVRAISQTLALALASGGCGDTKCAVPAELEKAMSLFGAVASYLRVYDDTKALDPAEAKAARKKAIESLIDGATDRRERAGDWIVSLGIPVGLSAGKRWTPGTDASGYKSDAFRDAYEKERAFAWRVPLGLAVQHMNSGGFFSPGCHLGVTFADLGNFLRGQANDKEDKVQWKDFVQIGGQAGVLFGTRRHSFVLALDVAWSPGVYQRNVQINVPGGYETRTLSGALMAGITFAYYVPLFDLN